MKVTEESDVKRTEFESVRELLQLVESPCSVADRFRSSLKGTPEFTGSASLDEALGLARTGWPGGLDTINRFRVSIEDLLRGQIPVPSRRYRMRGKKIDMGRYVTGQPDAFVQKFDRGLRRDAFAPKILRVVVNISASGAISPETILLRGAALVVLVDTLERRRIRCSIDLVSVMATRLNGGAKLEYRVNVKRDSEFVSVDTLAFLTAHASTMRRLIFALAEHEDDTVRTRFGIGQDKGGYAIPGDTDEQGDIYLPRMLSPVDWSEDLTLAWLARTMKEQGLVLQEED